MEEAAPMDGGGVQIEVGDQRENRADQDYATSCTTAKRIAIVDR